MKKKVLISLVLALIYFLVAFLTLKDYNISWDEILHFSRGQAYLHYFLTGKTNYQDLSQINLQGTFGEPKNIPMPRRSYYQLTDFHDGEYFLGRGGGGHPPLSDVLAAVSNYIFFQKLGILDDISAYHLYNILAASLLIFVVVFFALETLGLFPALISFLVLTTYPLFWAESHFNIKDFTLAAFFTGFIWAFFKSLRKFSFKWLAISILFFSFGLGTKFNILFAIPIVVLYFLYRYRKNLFKTISLIPKRYLVLVILAPFISLAILTAFWPFLWPNWLVNLSKVAGFYKSVGTGTNYQPQSFYFAGFNLFPVLWILFTTPPVTLALLLVGIVVSFLKKGEKDSVYLLWLLWFVIPIVRVMAPGFSIYGGVRQISEFVPAMALLSGLGAWQIKKWFGRNKVILLLTVLIFIWPVFILFRLHPNENVYFNFLIGGLKGASEKKFPSWGNSLGNAYLQGIKWINKNASKGAKLALIQGTANNLPLILVREDIDYKGENWSGINRGGEYLMELTFNDTAREFNYAWEYVNNFLVPVYELKVDGVSILKIWKNDLENTKKEYQLIEKTYKWLLAVEKNTNLLMVDLKKELILSRVKLFYTPFSGCYPIATSFLETSLDGINWFREKDRIPYQQVGLEFNSQGNEIRFYIAGKKARYIRFWLDNANSCGLGDPRVYVTSLQ